MSPLREHPIERKASPQGEVVFRTIAPGSYRIEAHHPKAVTRHEEVEVDGLKPVFAGIALPSAHLYFRDRGDGPGVSYRDALNAVFGRWKEVERLGWAVDLPTTLRPEVMIGIGLDPGGKYLAFALHPSARIQDALEKGERLAKGQLIEEHLAELPSLDKIEVHAATRSIDSEMALAVICTWRSSIGQAAPRSSVFPEVIDGNRYSFAVADGPTQMVAETENLSDRLLSRTPRTRAMSLMTALHRFADRHISDMEFEWAVTEALEPSCQRAKPANRSLQQSVPRAPP